MPSRVDGENICSVCFVGGFLSAVGAAKGVVNMVPAALYLALPSTLIALWYLPRNLFLSYRTLLFTPHLGPNLTVLAFLSAWMPIALWPLLVLFGSLGKLYKDESE